MKSDLPILQQCSTVPVHGLDDEFRPTEEVVSRALIDSENFVELNRYKWFQIGGAGAKYACRFEPRGIEGWESPDWDKVIPMFKDVQRLTELHNCECDNCMKRWWACDP